MKSQFRNLCLSICLLSATACRTTNPPSAAVKNVTNAGGLENVKRVHCEAGDLTYFRLKPVQNPGAYSNDSFDFLPNTQTNGFAMKGIQEGRLFRIDVCVAGDSVKLKQIVVSEGRNHKVYSVATDAKVEGLAEAVLGEDSSKLQIVVPYVRVRSGLDREWEDVQNRILLIQGAKDGKAVGAAVLAKDSDTWFGDGTDYVFGKFELEEPAKSGAWEGT